LQIVDKLFCCAGGRERRRLSFHVLRLLKLVVFTHVLAPLFFEFFAARKVFDPTGGLAKFLMREVSEKP
jgi:hypothetical protein